VPVKDSAKKSARLIRGAKEIYYPGAPHGLTATLQDQVNKDLLSFLKSVAKDDRNDEGGNRKIRYATAPARPPRHSDKAGPIHSSRNMRRRAGRYAGRA
jgi:hypothetical protein